MRMTQTISKRLTKQKILFFCGSENILVFVRGVYLAGQNTSFFAVKYILKTKIF